jgi:4-hydroxy-tetrahydrodipicolinate synthase
MMSMGGSGGVFFSANAAPKLAVELYETLKAGNYDRGRELQFRLMPLVSELVARSYPAGIKAALNLLGLPSGHVRFPLSDYNDQEVARLRRVLKDLELL